MVIAQLITHLASELDTDDARFEAELMVMKAAGLSRTELIVNSRCEAAEDAVLSAHEMLKRRRNGEPLQYILGTAEFMSLEFVVNRHTLIPRQDTETLVEYLIQKIGDKNACVLDIGAGSGCIGISLAHYCKNIDLTMLDISENALDTARLNAENNGVRAKFLGLDIMKEYPRGKFDVIVSNPPYIKTAVIDSLDTQVKDHEPRSALDGGEDGLVFYRRICSAARYMLTEKGRLAFEIGYDQGNEVYRLMKENCFEDVEILKDMCGNDRVVSGIAK